MPSSSLVTRRQLLQALGGTASLALFKPARAAGADGGAGTGAGAKATPFKILSCNIRFPVAEDAASGNAWVDRRDLCTAVIARQKPDIVCLQEAHQRAVDDLKDALPGFASFGLANPGPTFEPANPILFSEARFEFVSAGGYWLSLTPHVAGSKSWDSSGRRFTNWVHLRERAAGRELRVWSAHLDHRGQLAREQQVRLLVEGSQVLSATFPQLLAGDFNADVANPAMAVITANGWIDTYAAACGPVDPGFTYHGFRGPEFAVGGPKSGRRGKIDWIFCRGAVRTLAAEIIRDGHNGRFPSDHYFVSSTVELTAALPPSEGRQG